jgi:hypothetical protein
MMHSCILSSSPFVRGSGAGADADMIAGLVLIVALGATPFARVALVRRVVRHPAYRKPRPRSIKQGDSGAGRRAARTREVEDSCRSRIALGAGADEEHRDRAAACNRPGGQELRPQATVDADTAAAAQTRSAVDEAQANLAFEHEQLVVIGSSEAVARALVASAEAALLSAKFALIPRSGAPIDGIVANRKTRNRSPAAGSQLPPGNGLSEKLASKREFSWLRGPATTETDTHWRSPFDR